MDHSLGYEVIFIIAIVVGIYRMAFDTFANRAGYPRPWAYLKPSAIVAFISVAGFTLAALIWWGAWGEYAFPATIGAVAITAGLLWQFRFKRRR